MATVVNSRDVLLQAATPRVATISAAPNLVVSQSQVQGLGIVVDGTRLAMLQATSQVFQVPKTGSVSPTSTTLTAVVRNISGIPSLTVTSGALSTPPVLVGGAVTIPYANMLTDTVTIRLTAIDGSNTYTDDMTLVKVREGIDSFNGLLTNESHTLPADSLGNVLSYTGAGGAFKVFQGAVDVTALCVFSMLANPSSLTYSINPSTGVYAITGGYPSGTDTTTITFRATLGTVTLDKVFTVSKSKAGSTGVRGSRTYYVVLSGTTNTFSDTLATTTVTADGGPVLNDTVTQYNNSQQFSQTKFWTGSAWVVVNAIVDGNLLVSGTVGTTHLAANAVTAGKIAANAIVAGDGVIGSLAVQTLQIANNAVTVPITAAYGSAGATFPIDTTPQVPVQVSLAVPTGTAIQVTCSTVGIVFHAGYGRTLAFGTTPSIFSIYYEIVRDGSTVIWYGYSHEMLDALNLIGSSCSIPFSVTVIDTAANAASHTYSFRISYIGSLPDYSSTGTVNGLASAGALCPVITALAVKK